VRPGRFLLAAAAALVCATSSAAAAEPSGIVRKLGSSDGPTNVSVHAASAAWSERRRRTGRHVLKAYVGGRVVTPRVAAARRPFDVDLGPDGAGRLTAVYSRCRVARDDAVGDIDPTASRGCSLYTYSFRTRRERRLRLPGPARSVANPAIWKGQVVFASRRRSGEIDAYAYRLGSGRPPRRVAVTAPARREAVRLGLSVVRGAGAVELDLHGTRLAARTAYSVRSCEDGSGFDPELTHIEVLSLSSGRTRTVAKRCSAALSDPHFDASGGLWYLSGTGWKRQLHREGSDVSVGAPLDILHGGRVSGGQAVVTYTREKPVGVPYLPVGIALIRLEDERAYALGARRSGSPA
jgi:hypothetical protein